jgi:hypothetical protein
VEIRNKFTGVNSINFNQYLKQKKTVSSILPVLNGSKAINAGVVAMKNILKEASFIIGDA